MICSASSEGQLVGRLQRRTADAADYGGAVAADQGIVDGTGADGTPEGLVICNFSDRRGFGCERHPEMSVA